MPSQVDIAYTAAIIDGEGCISIGQHKRPKDITYDLNVRVGTTDTSLCYWLKSIYGGSVCAPTRRNPRHKQPYQWQIVSNQAVTFLLLVFPYLKLKVPQALVGIGFQSGRSGRPRVPISIEENKRNKAFHRRMLSLNKKGP